MSVLNTKIAGVWTPIAGDVNASNPVNDAIAQLQAATAFSGWTVATLQNGFNAYGAGYQVPRYCKLGNIVYIEGATKDGVLGNAAFTLPVGFRPVVNHQWAVASWSVVGIVEVNVAGFVFPLAPADVRFVGMELNFSIL